MSCAALSPFAIWRANSTARRERQRAGRDPVAEGLALEELRDGVGDAVVPAEVEDREDVRVGQRRDGLGFALEPGEGVRVRGHGFGKHLDGDLPIELGIPRPIHLSHPACAERREDFVGTEPRAVNERHSVSARGFYSEEQGGIRSHRG